MKNGFLILLVVCHSVYASEDNTFTRENAIKNAFYEVFDSENTIAKTIFQRQDIKNASDSKNVDKILINLALKNANLVNLISREYKKDNVNVDMIQEKTDDVKQLKNLLIAVMKICCSNDSSLNSIIDINLQEILRNAIVVSKPTSTRTTQTIGLMQILRGAILDINIPHKPEISLQKILHDSISTINQDARFSLKQILSNALSKSSTAISETKDSLRLILSKAVRNHVVHIQSIPDNLRDIFKSLLDTSKKKVKEKAQKTQDSLRNILQLFLNDE